MGRKIGLSFWAYLGDNVIDSPSGANFYLPSVVSVLQDRDYEIYSLQQNRDGMLSEPIKFENFLADERRKTYEALNFVEGSDFPDLDILYVEWRWPIQGRNTFNDIGVPGFTPDLLRQTAILDYYLNKKNTKIVIWDQDYKLSEIDEEKFLNADSANVKIVETSVFPKKRLIDRYRIQVPFDFDTIYEYGINFGRDKILYVGNNYERERMIDEYMLPISEKYPGKVQFYGNWRKYPEEFERISNKWPNIVYNDRITKADFLRVYQDSLCVPLLAKDDYLKHGHMTARLLESLYFGSLPIGFREFNGIEFYLTDELIVNSAEDFIYKYEELMRYNYSERIKLYNAQIDRLKPLMDVHRFVDTIERI